MKAPLLTVLLSLLLPAAAPAAPEKPPKKAEKTPQQVLLEELKGRGLILFEKYMKNRRWDAYVMNADGTDIRQLTRTPDRHEHLVVAAPRGDRAFYVRTPSIDPNHKLLPFRNYAHNPWIWEGHLWSTDLAGKKHEAVRFLRDGFWAPVTEASGTSAPNERTVVYGGAWDQRISVLDLRTGHVKAYRVVVAPRHVACSPDLRCVWYAGPGDGWEMYRLDLRTGKVKGMGSKNFTWPTISHDGKKVVHCVSDRPELTDGIKDRSLVIRDALDGRHLRFLKGEKGVLHGCPAFSPDDRYLVYGTRRGMKTWTLNVMRLSDKVSVPIAAGPHRINPCWIAPPTRDDGTFGHRDTEDTGKNGGKNPDSRSRKSGPS